jgi:hypothetical protein
MQQSPKSVKRRRGEGQGRQERHSDAETDTHAFWKGVIFHLGIYVRILRSFLFKNM